jgi:peptidoglycan/xylan/chitin deacetylase (PgdA/CDA1 family)
MRKITYANVLIAIFCFIFPVQCLGEVITRLPTDEKIISFTFDACETKTPSYLDKKVLDFLLEERIPFSIFVSGKFARRNSRELSELSKNDLISVENHTLNHPMHMERLRKEEIYKEVHENELLIEDITGRKPTLFRFPGGNFDRRSLETVEKLGYKVVHWSFASGDPDRHNTADMMQKWVLSKVRPGSILIFHINGRGYHTGEALPGIVAELRKRGYRFVRLEDRLTSVLHNSGSARNALYWEKVKIGN